MLPSTCVAPSPLNVHLTERSEAQYAITRLCVRSEQPLSVMAKTRSSWTWPATLSMAALYVGLDALYSWTAGVAVTPSPGKALQTSRPLDLRRVSTDAIV